MENEIVYDILATAAYFAACLTFAFKQTDWALFLILTAIFCSTRASYWQRDEGTD